MKIEHGKQVMESLDEVVAPGHTALLMLDMINDFLSPAGKLFNPNATDLDQVLATVPRIAQMLEAARSAGVLPVYVQNTFLSQGLDLSAGYLYFLHRRGVTLSDPLPTLEGTWGAQTIPQLKPREGEPVVTKRSYSGFLDTRLDAVLRSNGIETIVITGASSYGCIVTTALEGFCYGYYVAVPRECTAGTIRDWHQAAMSLMSPLLVGYEDVLKVWQESASARASRPRRNADMAPRR